MHRGTYNDGRNQSSYASGGGYTDDRNVTSYGEDGYSDHVCRPVIVDAEGRKRPIISYGAPNAGQESYVTTRTARVVGTERIVEHVRSPVVVTDYNTYSSQAIVEPLKEYGATNDKWSNNPSNKVYDRPEYGYNSPSKMEPVRNYGVDGDRPEYGYNSPSKLEPVRNYGVAGDRPEYGYNSPSKLEPVRNYGVAGDRPEYGYNSPSKLEPVRNYGVAGDRPEYGYNSPSKMEPVRNYGGQDRPQNSSPVQTEASRQTRPGLLSPNLWRNQPSSTTQGYGATKGYGGEYANNNDDNINKKLTSPISDIGTAMEVLKDAAKASSAIGPKRDGYSETIDSREAAKRYGNLNLASRPYQAGETYMGTIDSREAARRYGGARV